MFSLLRYDGAKDLQYDGPRGNTCCVQKPDLFVHSGMAQSVVLDDYSARGRVLFLQISDISDQPITAEQDGVDLDDSWSIQTHFVKACLAKLVEIAE